MKRVLFFLNHPAHYHLFKNVIKKLKDNGHHVLIYIVTKDILEDLVKEAGWSYVNLFPEGRRDSKGPSIFSTAKYMFKTWIRLNKAVAQDKPDLMIGTERTITHIGRLRGIQTLYVHEDDTVATPENYITYPFATKVIMPKCCDVGKWERKKVTYDGYHELAYLHPNYFTPDENRIKQFNPGNDRYFILRLAELSASHDLGKTGITDSMASDLIHMLSEHGKVFITSERPLKEEFEKNRLNIDPHDIFHALYYADLYIGDSQTMAAEAAVLGTPSIRFNDFVGKIGYLNELESLYDLTYGFKTSESQKMFDKINELLNTPNLKSHWRNKSKVMLVEKQDVAEFMTGVIEDYAGNKN